MDVVDPLQGKVSGNEYLVTIIDLALHFFVSVSSAGAYCSGSCEMFYLNLFVVWLSKGNYAKSRN